MKTTIIRLQKHDDLATTRDKMGWVKGGRIVLVWPDSDLALNRRLDLVLLQRYSAKLGSPLALVSHDPEVRYLAPRLGIPVFNTLHKAEKERWRAPRRYRLPLENEIIPPAKKTGAGRLPPKPPAMAEERLTPAARLTYFGMGVLALLAIAAVLTPSALLRLTPQTQIQQKELQVWAAAPLPIAGLSGGVPGRWVRVTVEGRDWEPASGSIAVAERTAQGSVRFTNLTDAEVEIPAGMLILTLESPPVRFTVIQAGLLPPGPGTTIDLNVRALDPGEQGNLPAGSLTAIESLLGAQASATNPQPTRGGSSRPAPAPTSADRQALRERLTSVLEATALLELERQLAPDDMLIPASLRLINELEAAFQPVDDLPADRLGLSLRLEYEAMAVAGSDISVLAGTLFDTEKPVDFSAIDGSLKLEAVSTPAPLTLPESGGTAYRWTMRAQRRLTADIQAAQAIRLVLGRSPANARDRLQSALPLAEPPQIMVQPSWWLWLPILPLRVQVISQAGAAPDQEP